MSYDFQSSGTCRRRSLFYKTVKNTFSGNVNFNIRNCEVMYLNLYNSYTVLFLPMSFDSKFKINLYHEHFPEAFENFTRFPKFTLLLSISHVRIDEVAYMRLSLLLLSVAPKFLAIC